MSDRAFIGSQPVGQASASQSVTLGCKQVVDDLVLGRQEFVYILNGDASQLEIGAIVQRKTNIATGHVGIICVSANTPKWQLLGVAQSAIPAGQYGWILCDGTGVCLGDGSVTKDLAVESNGTAGRAVLATITNLAEAIAVFGVSLTDDAAAGSLFNVRVTGL